MNKFTKRYPRVMVRTIKGQQFAFILHSPFEAPQWRNLVGAQHPTITRTHMRIVLDIIENLRSEPS